MAVRRCRDAPQAEQPAFCTPANLHVFEFDWAPDSQSLAYVAADPPGENNWWVAKLYTQKLQAMGRRAILSPGEVAGAAAWHADGGSALVAGWEADCVHRRPDERPGRDGRRRLDGAGEGGAPHDVAPALTATAAWLEWDGARRLYVNEIAGGVITQAGANGPERRWNSGAHHFQLAGHDRRWALQLGLSSSADRLGVCIPRQQLRSRRRNLCGAAGYWHGSAIACGSDRSLRT